MASASLYNPKSGLVFACGPSPTPSKDNIPCQLGPTLAGSERLRGTRPRAVGVY